MPKVNKLKREFLDIRKDIQTIRKDEKANRAERDLQLIEFIKTVSEYLDKIYLELYAHETVLAQMLLLHKEIGETLSHVLIAIRQNEYLQSIKSEEKGHEPLRGAATIFIGIPTTIVKEENNDGK